MIKKAELKHMSEMVKVTYLSGPNIFKYLFPVDKSKIMLILQMLYRKPMTLFSKDYYYIYENNNKVQGAISFYSGTEKRTLEKNIMKFGKEIGDIAGKYTSFKMKFRKKILKYIPTINNDEFYIQSLAVLPEYRGNRIASALINFACSQAKSKNFHKVSLLVEKTNAHAINVYTKIGFKIVETSNIENKFKKYKINGFHKMVVKI